VPRCGCQDSCSCLITAGPGVTVEGIGTLERPYEIGAESGTLEGRLIFDDGGGVDFTAIGAGSSTAPQVVTGSVALTALSDVSTDVPAEGNVPVWRTDHWEWETAPAAVPVSGVWGTPPLDTAIYGANPVTGDEIYLDAGGQIRSRPQTIAQQLIAALPTAYPQGYSLFYLGAGEGVNWPSLSSGIVVTHKTANNVALQQCAQYSTTATKVWTREGGATGWGPWEQTAGKYRGTAPCSAVFTPGAAQTDITGMTLTVPVGSTSDVYQVNITLDAAVVTASGGNFIAALSVTGLATPESGKQVIWNATTATPAGGRQMLSQNYLITGVTPGNMVFKATAAGTTFKVNPSHSSITVVQIA
jgi:hypothetical protein